MPGIPLHTKRTERLILITLVGSIVQGIQAESGAAQDLPLEEIREIAGRALAELPGLSIAVGKGDSILWADGFGLASLESGTPVTAGTRFRVYSVSKPWTAAAALRLVEAGRLDPQAPIQVAGFPDKGAPITAYQLGMHSAGIRHYRAGEAEMDRRCRTVAEALALFADDPLLFPPGTDRSYSTWGYVLLGAVLERAAGRPFAGVLEEEVLVPAGMTATAHAAGEDGEPAEVYERDAAGGYRSVGETTDPSCKWGGGGYLATAADLVRFPLAAFSGRLQLSDSSLALLFDRSEGPVDRAGGSGPGGTAHVRTDLDSGLVIALAANVGGGLDTLGSVGDEIAAAIELASGP